MSKTDSAGMKQQTLELVVSQKDICTVEIRWALRTVIKRHSSNSNDNITSFFKSMFPDNKFAKLFGLGADKTRYVINYDIAPYFCEF